MASKYKNKKCEHIFQNETYKFDSLLEKLHAIKLFSMLKQGNISKLILQPEFQLLEPFTVLTNSTKNGKSRQRAITYIADFSYIKDGKKIVADSKGIKSPTYAVKKKMFLSQLEDHGIDEFQELYKSEDIIYKRFNQKPWH